MKSDETYKDLPVLFFADQAAWHAWLAEHHADGHGVWLKFAKKDSGITSLTYEPALLEALCYGWIDGLAKPIDETYYMQKFIQRRPKSLWSKRNRARVEKLIEAGLMQPAGQAEIDAAKADGRWDAAYDSPTTITMPDDFAKALDANPKAKAFYDTLNKTNTFAVLWRVVTAKRPETRARRIEKLISMLEQEQKIH